MSPEAQRVYEFTHLDVSALWIICDHVEFFLLSVCSVVAVPRCAAGWRCVWGSVELQVQGEEEEGEHGAGLGMGEGTDLGDGLG